MNMEDQSLRVYNRIKNDAWESGEEASPKPICARFKPADLRSPDGVWIDGRKFTEGSPASSPADALTGGRPIYLAESEPGEEENPSGHAAHRSTPAGFLRFLFSFKRAGR